MVYGISFKNGDFRMVTGKGLYVLSIKKVINYLSFTVLLGIILRASDHIIFSSVFHGISYAVLLFGSAIVFSTSMMELIFNLRFHKRIVLLDKKGGDSRG